MLHCLAGRALATLPGPHSKGTEAAMPLSVGGHGDRGPGEVTECHAPQSLHGVGHPSTSAPRRRTNRCADILFPFPALGAPKKPLSLTVRETSTLPWLLGCYFCGLDFNLIQNNEASWPGYSVAKRRTRQHPPCLPCIHSRNTLLESPSSFKGVSGVTVPKSGSISERQVPGPCSRKLKIYGLNVEPKNLYLF